MDRRTVVAAVQQTRYCERELSGTDEHQPEPDRQCEPPSVPIVERARDDGRRQIRRIDASEPQRALEIRGVDREGAAARTPTEVRVDQTLVEAGILAVHLGGDGLSIDFT